MKSNSLHTRRPLTGEIISIFEKLPGRFPFQFWTFTFSKYWKRSEKIQIWNYVVKKWEILEFLTPLLLNSKNFISLSFSNWLSNSPLFKRLSPWNLCSTKPSVDWMKTVIDLSENMFLEFLGPALSTNCSYFFKKSYWRPASVGAAN